MDGGEGVYSFILAEWSSVVLTMFLTGTVSNKEYFLYFV